MAASGYRVTGIQVFRAFRAQSYAHSFQDLNADVCAQSMKQSHRATFTGFYQCDTVNTVHDNEAPRSIFYLVWIKSESDAGRKGQGWHGAEYINLCTSSRTLGQDSEPQHHWIRLLPSLPHRVLYPKIHAHRISRVMSPSGSHL